MEKKYTIAKSDYWVSIKKRAKKENAIFDLTIDEFYLFLKERFVDICKVANQDLSPYVTRIEDLLPYKLGNLKVEGKPKARHAIKGVHGNGGVLEFPSLHAAAKHGYYRSSLIRSIENKIPYKEYIWQYI